MKPSGNETRQVRRISPSSGFSSPAIMLMIVVLPVPFGARMPSDLPQFDPEGGPVEDHLALLSGPEGLADVDEFDHRGTHPLRAVPHGHSGAWSTRTAAGPFQRYYVLQESRPAIQIRKNGRICKFAGVTVAPARTIAASRRNPF